MGKQIRIFDLAKLMIQFSGKKIKKKGNGDIEIKITGLRPGEKLYEELLVDKNSKSTNVDNIFISLEKNIKNYEFQYLFKNITLALKLNNKKKLFELLKNKYVNFKHEKF